uniref:Uncharacterized protein n=1 Tax=Romanomermis culicivorax TaxID=13658 RepID=A0A915L2P2_ROMCU
MCNNTKLESTTNFKLSLSFKKSSDKSPRPLRIIHPPQPTPSQNSIDQRQTKVVTWAVGSAKRPSLSRSFSTGSMTEQDAFPGDHSKNRTLSRSQDEERASWNISSDSTTSPDSGR